MCFSLKKKKNKCIYPVEVCVIIFFSNNVLQLLVYFRIPEILSCLESVDVSHEDLLLSFISFFKSLNAGFGKTVAREKVSFTFFTSHMHLSHSKSICMCPT